MNNNEANQPIVSAKPVSKLFLIQSGIRIFFLGLALIGTVWLMAALNAGSFIGSPNNPTSILLGIPAQKTH
jgi:hypothetical protein